MAGMNDRKNFRSGAIQGDKNIPARKDKTDSGRDNVRTNATLGANDAPSKGKADQGGNLPFRTGRVQGGIDMKNAIARRLSGNK